MAARAEKLKELDRLKSSTHCMSSKSKLTEVSSEEIHALFNFFDAAAVQEKIDRNSFRDILHQQFNLTDAVMLDRLFRAFTRSTESSLNKDEWVRGLSILLRGTLDEQIEFVFRIYLNNVEDYATRHINRDTMFFLLKNTMVKIQSEEERDEGIKELVDLVLKKMDVDHDGKLSLDDYRTSVHNDPLLLEALGDCLPSEKAVRTFMDVVMSMYSS